LRLISTTSTPR